MRILIVEQDSALAEPWSAQIALEGAEVVVAASLAGARAALEAESFDGLVVNLALPGTSALTIAELASFLTPDVSVVFVTPDDRFSGGAIFAFSANAKAYLPTRIPPADLAAIVAYHAAAR